MDDKKNHKNTNEMCVNRTLYTPQLFVIVENHPNIKRRLIKFKKN